MLLIKNGLLFTMSESEPFYGDLLADKGRLVRVGGKIAATGDMQVIDAQNMQVYPGFIDAHSHIGISEEKTGRQGDDCNEGTDPQTACMRAIDAINPMDSAFHNALAAGITGAMVGPGS